MCRCEYGVINCCYPASDLEKYNGTLSFEVHAAISLREAAWKSALWHAFVDNICNLPDRVLNT